MHCNVFNGGIKSGLDHRTWGVMPLSSRLQPSCTQRQKVPGVWSSRDGGKGGESCCRQVGCVDRGLQRAIRFGRLHATSCRITKVTTPPRCLRDSHISLASTNDRSYKPPTDCSKPLLLLYHALHHPGLLQISRIYFVITFSIIWAHPDKFQEVRTMLLLSGIICALITFTLASVLSWVVEQSIILHWRSPLPRFLTDAATMLLLGKCYISTVLHTLTTAAVLDLSEQHKTRECTSKLTIFRPSQTPSSPTTS